MIGKVVQNDFYEGMDKELSKFKYSPSKYEDALNIRILTGEGLSSGSIENEQGTLELFSMPGVQTCYGLYMPTGLHAGDVITIGGYDFTLDEDVYNLYDLYDKMLNDSTIVGQIDAGMYKIGINGEYITILGTRNSNYFSFSCSSANATIRTVAESISSPAIVG